MYRRTLIFGLVSTTAFSGAVTRDSASAAGVRLECRTFVDRPSLPHSGEFVLTAMLESMQEGSELFVPLTWGFRGFQVDVTDASGTQSLPAINDFHPPPPLALNRPESFVRMYKGMLVGETLRQRASDIFPKRGRFIVRVRYLSPVPRAYTSVANAIVEEDGSFSAAPISVIIT